MTENELRVAYLQVDTFAFDTETDTNDYHWVYSAVKPQRGLSIAADFFAISFYAEGLEPLVLFAEQSIDYRDVDYLDENFQEKSHAQEFFTYRFKNADLQFINMMFDYHREVTIVGHNLVFDIRQVFVKLGIEVSPNHVYYDTLVINNLLSGADEVENDVDGDDEEYALEAPEVTDKSAKLEALAGRFLPTRIHNWWKAMKKYRTCLTDIVYDYHMSNKYIDEGDTHPNHTYETVATRQRGKKDDVIKYKVSEQDVRAYAALDSEMALRLYKHQLATPRYSIDTNLFSNGNLQELIDIDLDYIRVCCDMAVRGSKVDRDYLKMLRADYAKQVDDMLKKMMLTNDIFHKAQAKVAYFSNVWMKTLGNYKGDAIEAIREYASLKVETKSWGNTDNPNNTVTDYVINIPKHYLDYLDSLFSTDDLLANGVKPVKDGWDGESYYAFTSKHYTDTLINWWNTGSKEPLHMLILMSALGIIKPNDEKRYGLLTKKNAPSYSEKAARYYLAFIPEMEDFAYLMNLYSKLMRINEFLRHSEYNGRVHSILARIAITGRNTSSSPNLQNLQMAKKKKSLDNYPDVALDIGFMIPDPDFTYVELDYSNAENWIAAMYAKDNVLASACANDDFHSVMASTVYYPELWDKSSKDERKVLRNKGKNVTFGTAYGMGPMLLSVSLGITYEEAKLLIDNKEKGFVAVRSAKQRSSDFALRTGYTQLWTGRRIKIRYDFRGKLKAYTAWNTLAQGGVGEITTRAMIEIYTFLRDNNFKSYIANQVHDAIIIAMHKDEYETIAQTLIEMMSRIMPERWNQRTTPNIRWLVDIDHRSNAKKWGWQYNKEYQLPTDHYLNRWGKHNYAEKSNESKVWINEFGYGETALKAELALQGVENVVREPVAQVTYSLEDLYNVCKRFTDLMETPFVFDGNAFVGKDAYLLKKALRMNGIDKNSHLQYEEIFASIATITEGVKDA